MKYSPRMLDWAINGIPVYFRRRPADGKVYATTTDFSKWLKEAPLETVRLRVEADTLPTWEPTEDPRILKKLAEYNR